MASGKFYLTLSFWHLFSRWNIVVESGCPSHIRLAPRLVNTQDRMAFRYKPAERRTSWPNPR